MLSQRKNPVWIADLKEGLAKGWRPSERSWDGQGIFINVLGRACHSPDQPQRQIPYLSYNPKEGPSAE